MQNIKKNAGKQQKVKDVSNLETELVFVLDRSGSMSGLESDTIGGFNRMLKEQKKGPEKCYVTTVLFDHEYQVLHNHVDIKKVKELTDSDYVPRGRTALLDAVGKTINTVKPKKDRKVIFVITTDGYENASQEYSGSLVKELVEKHKQKDDWEFMFFGADIDTFAVGRSFGINANDIHGFTKTSAGVMNMHTLSSMDIANRRMARMAKYRKDHAASK